MNDTLPAAVLAFVAATLPQLGPRPPHPIAWKEYPEQWVIVFEDGRKLHFPKKAVMKNPAAAKKEQSK